ncbi:MAG: 50S ribosomal protein L30 [Ignavibacteriales bacterium]|nr:50S ribosomal protein L30 [Ignavibacteriales bacterium]MBI3789219.1 50S ribosomal protein L30 [Ignavibacteriales bacterium]
MAETKKIKITQVRSVIDHLENAKRTIKALGLGRPNYSVIKNDTPQIRGMINAVRSLVRVEEVK